MIINAAKRIFNSDKIYRSYSDLSFGVTFLEHSVYIFCWGGAALAPNGILPGSVFTLRPSLAFSYIRSVTARQ